jgi:hypothetical protein
VAPKVAEGISVTHADPAATWLSAVGSTGGPLRPAAVATVHLTYDDTKSGLDHKEVFEAVIHPLHATVGDDNLHLVDHDPRDFRDEAPAGATYEFPDAALDTKTFWNGLAKNLADHLYRNRSITIQANPGLKLYSRIGESPEDFAARCGEAAEDAADADIAKLKDTYATKIDRVRDQISTAERRVSELESDVAAQKQDELLSGAGDLLGAIIGGRRRSSSISRAASRRSQTRKKQGRLDAAIDAMEGKAADLIELEDSLQTDVLEITDRWNRAAAEVEAFEVGLDKTDIDVEPLGLTWLP